MYESILLKNIAFYFVIFLLLSYASICFFKGINAFNNEKIVTDSFIMQIVATKFIPLILISISIWLCSRPILDYFIKDYQDKTGIIENVNSPYRYIVTDEVYFIGEPDRYYISKHILNSENKGEEYEFIYAKRSRIILEIHKTKK